MVHTKYKFTPQDIAAYLLKADLPRFREDEIIADFFQEHGDDIVFDYRNERSVDRKTRTVEKMNEFRF